jgi:hypothetical protein
MFEYKVIHIGKDETTLTKEEKASLLNVESENGWELVSVDNGLAYLRKVILVAPVIKGVDYMIGWK